MMSDNEQMKTHAVRVLHSQGKDVRAYAALLLATPTNRTIAALAPWAFDPDPERAASFCSSALGRPVLPFAQAVGENMMACFEVGTSAAASVVVIDPWVKNQANVVLAELPDFDAWLVYAKKVAQDMQARKQADGEED
jgi:hypothetical protein